MRVLTVGGGSGGHVTPIVAIIKELKKRDKKVDVRFWCDRGFSIQAKKIISQIEDPPVVKTIFAGKLRRYHNRTAWQQLRDIPTLMRNLADMFLFILGFWQSLVSLIAWRPQVIFTKGGFVCLPVGLAAVLLRIPIVIHDSDTHPGLTNRILARFARAIATGAPVENYSYPAAKTHYVGIPIRRDFKPYSLSEQQKTKQQLSLPKDMPIVLVTGGGLGALNINQAVLAVAEDLLKYTSIIHVCGAKRYQECQARAPHRANYKLLPFVDNMAQLMGAADVVVTRAGATTMLELAASGKATIVIPNALLVAGHQVKNAKMYATKDAVQVINEDEMVAKPTILQHKIINLLKNADLRHRLGKKLSSFAKPQAAVEVVNLIEQAAKAR